MRDPAGRRFRRRREDAHIESDASVHFLSDRTVVRAKLLADFLFPQLAGINRIALTG